VCCRNIVLNYFLDLPLLDLALITNANN